MLVYNNIKKCYNYIANIFIMQFNYNWRRNMNNYVIEQYLIYLISNDGNKNVYYLLKKYKSGKIIIKNNCDSDNEKMEEIIKKYLKILEIASLKYATKYLSNSLDRMENLNILKYMNVKECEALIAPNYTIRVVKYYLDSKGKMFSRLMGVKWNDKTAR